jgi:ABC-2 type transport system permease protein
MSRARAIYLVARREILERGRSRAFLISLALTVVFVLAGIFLPKLIGGEDQAHKLGVVGTPPAGFDAALAATSAQADLKVATSSVPRGATQRRLA